MAVPSADPAPGKPADSGTALRIVIVGAGIAGLSAGVSLRRAGHVVHIYERSAMNNEVGAAINVPPNATRFLLSWGLDPVKNHFVRAGVVGFMDPYTLGMGSKFSHSDSEQKYNGAALWYAHRVDLHESLKKMATTSEGPGVPVTIHLNSYVVGYNPDLPSITLADGEAIRADLVIGADGLHSIACETVLGRKNQPIPPSHYNCCYRFLISAETLEEDPETRWWNDMDGGEGMLRIFPHNETNRRLVSYPCRDGTVHNFVGIFNDENMKNANREDYLANVDKTQVLERFADFHPSLLAVVNKATEIKRWPLLYRPPIPSWRKGKLVLAGDAAHPMLPHQGQGGAQGLEDGVVLGIVLNGARTPEQVEERLALYEKIRRNRASAIQILSNVGQDQCHLVRDELMQFVAEKDIPTNPVEIYRFNFGHDVVGQALKVMTEFDPEFKLPEGFFVGNQAQVGAEAAVPLQAQEWTSSEASFEASSEASVESEDAVPDAEAAAFDARLAALDAEAAALDAKAAALDAEAAALDAELAALDAEGAARDAKAAGLDSDASVQGAVATPSKSDATTTTQVEVALDPKEEAGPSSEVEIAPVQAEVAASSDAQDDAPFKAEVASPAGTEALPAAEVEIEASKAETIAPSEAAEIAAAKVDLVGSEAEVPPAKVGVVVSETEIPPSETEAPSPLPVIVVPAPTAQAVSLAA